MAMAHPSRPEPSVGQQRLARRAQRAYELGRLRAAGRVLWWLGPTVVLATLVARRVEMCSCIGGIVVVATIFARWRGRATGDAVTHGVFVGALVGAAGLGTNTLLKACPDQGASSFCGALCAVAGAVGGYALFRLSSARDNGWSPKQWALAGVAAFITAPLSCSDLSRGQLLALLGGVLAASVSVLVLRRPFADHAR
jgi:hypothetical protein